MLLLRENPVLELYELRQINGTGCGGVSCRRHTEDDMNCMRQALSEMKAHFAIPIALCRATWTSTTVLTRASENTAMETTMRNDGTTRFMKGGYRIMPLIKDIKETYARHEAHRCADRKAR